MEAVSLVGSAGLSANRDDADEVMVEAGFKIESDFFGATFEVPSFKATDKKLEHVLESCSFGLLLLVSIAPKAREKKKKFERLNATAMRRRSSTHLSSSCSADSSVVWTVS